jgi:hypothetical protein
MMLDVRSVRTTKSVEVRRKHLSSGPTNAGHSHLVNVQPCDAAKMK